MFIMRKHFVWTFISLTKTATQLFIMPFVLCCIVLIINACDNFLPVGPDGNTCEYDGLFDPATIVEVNIEMAPANWDFIRTQTRKDLFGEKSRSEPFYSPFIYRTGTVTVNGEVLHNVGIRKKGFVGSLDENKPSLKVKFDEYVAGQELFGLDRLTLNNNKSDPTFVRQCIAYSLFRKAGVPAPRCNFAHVTVNGQNLGLFSNVESIKERFLARHFSNNDGRLYEGTESDFREGQIGTFEAKTNQDNPDRSDLLAIQTALELPDEQLKAVLPQLINIDRFMNFWAIEMLVNHGDGYTRGTNNFFIYFEPTTGLMEFIPWGADKVFFLWPSKTASDVVFAESILARRLYMLPETREKFVAAMRQILTTVWNENELLEELDRMEALIAPIIANDPLYPSGSDTAGKGLPHDVRAFVRERRAELEPFLDNPPEPLSEGKSGEKGNDKAPDGDKKPDENEPKCNDGETFEKNGITYVCVDGEWVAEEKRAPTRATKLVTRWATIKQGK